MISYAQNFEDVMLWRALGHVENGFYIDVGAQHPINDSVSRAFYENGWRGLHVEPTQFYASLLRENRPDETVLQTAISTEAGVMKFFEIPGTGISTGDPVIAKRHQASGFQVHETTVSCITLASVFKLCAGKEIHWLKIDVEGMEKHVLESWRPATNRPWIVVVESTSPLTQTESHAEWEPLIIEKGYKFSYFDGLNRFYLSQEHVELVRAFSSGPNIFDNFSLSGVASSGFAAKLNEKIHALEASLATVTEIGAVALASREKAFVIRESEVANQMAASEARTAELTEILARREHEYIVQLAASKQESLQITQTLVSREQILGAQIQALYGDAVRMAEAHVVRERDFFEQQFSSGAQAIRLEELLVTRERELLLFRQNLANCEKNVSRMELELSAIKNSWPWKIMVPLRWLKNCLK